MEFHVPNLLRIFSSLYSISGINFCDNCYQLTGFDGFLRDCSFAGPDLQTSPITWLADLKTVVYITYRVGKEPGSSYAPTNVALAKRLRQDVPSPTIPRRVKWAGIPLFGTSGDNTSLIQELFSSCYLRPYWNTATKSFLWLDGENDIDPPCKSSPSFACNLVSMFGDNLCKERGGLEVCTGISGGPSNLNLSEYPASAGQF